MLSQGLLSTYMYPYTIKVYDFLNEYKYDEKFHSLKQLGAIQYFFKGAHHTRYEYIFLQWMIVNEMKNKAKGLGLNTEINSKNKSFILKGHKPPTKAELLQCLTVLTNMGHFPVTYSASKIWFHVIKQNFLKIRSALKEGLDEESKKFLDKIIDENDFYKIHLINSLFLLSRYRRKDKNGIVDFSISLLNEYVMPRSKDLLEVWTIYQSVRKMAYLYLDSNYAPIPFKIDLSSIILTLESYDTSILNDDSVFHKTLNEINLLLENNLYLAPNTILIGKYEGDFIKKKFFENVKTKLKTSEIKKILTPHINEDCLSDIFSSRSNSSINTPWDSDLFLNINYNMLNEDKSILNQDIRQLEEDFTNKLGRNSCTVGAMMPPSKDSLRLIFSIRKDYKNKTMKMLDIIKELITFDNKLALKNYKKSNQDKVEHCSSLLEYLLKYVFSNDFQVTFDFTQKGQVPFFIGSGSKTIAKQMNDYIKKLPADLNDDLIHEFKTNASFVYNLNYKGLIVAYLGSTKLMKKKESVYTCEIDGLICLPALKKDYFLYIIEAKNKSKSKSEAENQLDGNLKGKISGSLEYEIEKFEKRNAYAKVRSKR